MVARRAAAAYNRWRWGSEKTGFRDALVFSVFILRFQGIRGPKAWQFAQPRAMPSLLHTSRAASSGNDVPVDPRSLAQAFTPVERGKNVISFFLQSPLGDVDRGFRAGFADEAILAP
jgi:hypothetical protein